MSTKPFLSVIVPVYNVKPYLAECLDSILAQTFTDFEVLLIDDGSTDGSSALCDEYAGTDSRIRCFHKENGGHMSARQEGFRNASGTYIAFVDSDDWIHPAMYERMCAAAEESGADMVCCNYTAVTPEKQIERRDVCRPGFYNRSELEAQVYPTMLFQALFFILAFLPASATSCFAERFWKSTFSMFPGSLNWGRMGWQFIPAFWTHPPLMFSRNPSIIIGAAAVPSPTRWTVGGLRKTVCSSILTES